MKSKVLSLVCLLGIFQISYASSFVGVFKGMIKGAYITYGTSTSVDIKPGYGECNGNYWEIPLTVTYSVTDPNTSGFIYVYVDGNDESYPTLDSSSDFNDSMIPPSWSDSKQGWYRENHRCIGSVWWDDSSNSIKQFTTPNENTVIYTSYFPVMANGNPNGTLQNTTTDLDVITPVNAYSLHVAMYNYCGNTVGQIYLQAVSNPLEWDGIDGYNSAMRFTAWLETGVEDRSLYVWGQDDDLNQLTVNLMGWKFNR